MGTQGIALVVAFQLEQVVATEYLGLVELQRREVALARHVEQRLGKNNLVEEIPCSAIRQGTCSAGMDVPERIVESAILDIDNLTTGTQSL